MAGSEIIEYSLCCVNIVVITLMLGVVFSFLYSILGDIRDMFRRN